MAEKVSFKQLPGEPIIVVTLSKEYDFIADADEGARAGLAVLDRLKHPVFWVVDFHITPNQEHSLNLDQLLVSSNAVTRLWSDPRIRKVLLVTSDEIVRLAGRGMTSETFGNLPIEIFASLDEALRYARSQA